MSESDPDYYNSLMWPLKNPRQGTFSVNLVKEKPEQTKAQSEVPEGRKDDQEKLRVDLIPHSCNKEIAKVLSYGADKYGEYNWYTGIKYHRLYAAVLRHLYAWWEREEHDPESGLNHLSHAMCNLAFLMQFVTEERNSLDDRPDTYLDRGTGGSTWTQKKTF